jgi:hypothetical protein
VVPRARVRGLLARAAIGAACACRAGEPARDAASATPSDAAADSTSVADSGRAPAPPRQADGSWLLASLPAGAAGTVDVVLAPCGAAACPVRVRLRDGAGVRDSAAVEWESVVAAPRRDMVLASVIGIGDPLAVDAPVPAWTTGADEDAISTYARAVDLGPSTVGVLVHQSGGVEHVKRLHYVFVARDGRLTRAWRGWEGQGPTGSYVDTITTAGSAYPAVLYWRFATDDGVVTTWTLERMQWDARAGRFRPGTTSRAAAALATVARTFTSADAASAWLAAHPECGTRFQIMRTPARTAGVALVALTARRALADSAQRDAGDCGDGDVRVEAVEARRD